MQAIKTWALWNKNFTKLRIDKIQGHKNFNKALVKEIYKDQALSKGSSSKADKKER